MPTTHKTGSCLCGGVKYQVVGGLRPVMYCHCEQCRKTSGHYVAATACKPAQLTLTSDQTLRWFRSSSSAQRGFCNNCGASLFWRPEHLQYISIMAGTLNTPTGLKASAHIFVAAAADYYSIGDDLPQFEHAPPIDDHQVAESP